MGEQLTKINLVHNFASLLKDPEAEVRAAASNRLRGKSLLWDFHGGVSWVMVDLVSSQNSQRTWGRSTERMLFWPPSCRVCSSWPMMPTSTWRVPWPLSSWACLQSSAKTSESRWLHYLLFSHMPWPCATSQLFSYFLTVLSYYPGPILFSSPPPPPLPPPRNIFTPSYVPAFLVPPFLSSMAQFPSRLIIED